MGCFSGGSKVGFTDGGATAVEGSLTEGAAQHKTGFTMPLPYAAAKFTSGPPAKFTIGPQDY